METASPGARYREEPCIVALNHVKGMRFEWSLNPYMGCEHRCTFCYVRGFERRAGRPSDDRYGRSIRVKTNVVEVLNREVHRRGWKRVGVAIGTATDPYQPAEGTYRLTRRAINVLANSGTPISLITRGPLMIRDIDVLQDAAQRVDVSVNVSIPTLDNTLWRHTEPGTAPPRQRLRLVRALADAGIRVDVGLAPLLPGLSDGPGSLREVIAAARDAGATRVWPRMLALQDGVREHFLEAMQRDRPEIVLRYRAMYHGPYLPRPAEQRVAELVARLAEEAGFGQEPPKMHLPRVLTEPRQLSLFSVPPASTP